MKSRLLSLALFAAALAAQIVHPVIGNNYTQIKFDAATHSGATLSSADYSWSHTTGTGPNRLLVVWSGDADYNTIFINSVTYNGVALIHWDSCHSVDLWYMVNPPSGAHTMTVTRSGNTQSQSTAMTFSGAEQFRPIESWACNTTAGANPSKSVTTYTPGAWVADGYFYLAGALPTSSTWGIKTSDYTPGVNGTTTFGSATGPITTPGVQTDTYVASGGSFNGGYLVSIKPAAPTPSLQHLATPRTVVNTRTASWNWLDSRGGYYFQTLKGSKALYAHNATTLAQVASLVDNTYFPGIEGVQTRGNYAYISVSLDSANSTASVIDISNVLAGGSTMTHAAHITDTFLGTGATSTSCAFSHLSSVNPNLWFVGNGNGIMSIDITNPLVPVKISTLTTSVSPGALCAVWDGAWAGSPWDGNTLFVRGGKLDVTDPANMAFVGGVDTCRENSVVYGAYAWAPCSGSIHIWNPVTMADLGTVSISPAVPRVTTGDGRYLYIQDSGSTGIVWVVDVHTNPVQPRIVDSVRTYVLQDDLRVLPWSSLVWMGGPQTFAKMP